MAHFQNHLKHVGLKRSRPYKQEETRLQRDVNQGGIFSLVSNSHC